MKTIGMIGGMSWESSIEYYRIINQEARRLLGGTHSAKSIMVSVNFAEIEALQHAGDWDALTRLMIDAARDLQRGGADFIVICTNTMHRMAQDVQAAVGIPLLHIADATAAAVKAASMQTIGLLGTRYTMEQDFYRGRLEQQHALTVLTPPEEDRALVHQVIYGELVVGQVNPSSREQYARIMADLVARGAQGIILGCTEIGLLVGATDASVPLFDTTRLHAEAAVRLALGDAN